MRTCLSLVLVLALAAVPALAGEYHAGNNLICSDCHTMHFSMQHGWSGGSVTNGTGGFGGDWLGPSGPNVNLLKAPVNQLCMACHDAQTFAPDVFGANTNEAAYTAGGGREAGALNDVTAPDGYQTWMGHTLGSQAAPPGYNPAAVGLPITTYTGTTDPEGLVCTSCHSQHARPESFRNLNARGAGTAAANFRPTYVISNTNDITKDVWVNLPSYTAGTGIATNFGPYFSTATISFNRNDGVVGTTQTSNRLDAFCGVCHGDFHGGVNDANIAGTPGTDSGFIRHPNAGVTLGGSALTRFQGGTTRVHVVSSLTDYSDATPTCVTCHKGHGNQNPFGLVFLYRNATSVDEQGGLGAGQTATTPTGLRNLCGQCHGQGNQ